MSGKQIRDELLTSKRELIRLLLEKLFKLRHSSLGIFSISPFDINESFQLFVYLLLWIRSARRLKGYIKIDYVTHCWTFFDTRCVILILTLGGHMLAFLSCLETGLLPRGRLDPPLWSQRSGANSTTKRRRPLPALSESEETKKDYVFRIIDNSDHKDICKYFFLLSN